jgi:hypothetical protein
MDDTDGREVLAVVVKLTMEVAGDASLRLPVDPEPVRRGDQRRAGPDSCVLFPAELVESKPGTDVLLHGSVSASRHTSTEVRLHLETGTVGIDKRVRVFGPRVFRPAMLGVEPGEPEPLEDTLLCWENAYGGMDLTDPDEPLIEHRNPLGRGFVRTAAECVGTLMPCIEAIDAPSHTRHPEPAGFGPIEPHWEPRASRAGTFDDAWRAERAPLRPRDFDPRFNCSAPDDQWLAAPLSGGEPVEALGLAGGPMRFLVPRWAPVFESRMGDAVTAHPSHLDTLLVRADTRTIELSWRVAVPLPRKIERLAWVRITGSEPLDEALYEDLAKRLRARSMHPDGRSPRSGKGQVEN